ncbi:PEP/pyruvate-binding domain-containing protein [Niallia sp. FSL W8-0635]|uniref:PEP/pyruvate-binding domain-containing protein n=1 Tax=Niallia sp. FSL W8-0635 TaxID=2975337 RepID=UPI0030F6CF53
MINLLENTRKLNVEEIGNKAKNLFKLSSLNFNIPEGFVLTNNDCKEIINCKKEVLEQVNVEALKIWSEDGLIVRSSSSIEDSHYKTMAGKFSTKTISTFTDLIPAIISVYNSRLNHPMGVIVQRKIKADFSGVAFSLDPLRKSQGPIIEIVKGDGHKLVGGLSKPFQYKEDKWTSGDFSIDNVVSELKEYMNLLKNNLRYEIDVEFCIQNNTIFWLQVRPILGIKSNFIIPPSKEWFLLDQCTEPVTPLIQDLDPGGLFNSNQWSTTFINQYPYIKLKTSSNKTDSNEHSFNWDNIEKEYVIKFENTINTKCGNLEELYTELQKAIKNFKEFFNVYMDRDWMIKRRNIKKIILNFFDDIGVPIENQNKELGILTSNLNSHTFHKSRHLVQIAKNIQLLIKNNSTNEEEYPQFIDDLIMNSTSFKDFINLYGDEIPHPMAIHIETLRENPQYLIKKAKRLPIKNKKIESKWEDKLDKLQQKLPLEKKMKFRNAVLEYRNLLLRTENDDYVLQKGAASVRKVILDIGVILHRNGLLNNKHDVFFLRKIELEKYISGNSSENIDIYDRKIEFDKNRALMPSTALDETNLELTKNQNLILGECVSWGSVIGKVFIIENPLDRNSYLDIPEGSIIVAKQLTPHLTYNLTNSLGIIVETGGFLSHGAIFAREENIPAIIVNTSTRKLLKNNETIELNADKGYVKILRMNGD